MPVLHSPDSEYAKEMVKWEAQNSLLGAGLRPYLKRPYPSHVFKAGRVDGQIEIIETQIVGSEQAASNAYSRGFHPDPDAAVAGLKADELEIAKLAANRAFGEQRMSPQARAEVAALEAETSGHLPSVPETPRKPRGRPKKAPVETSTV